MPAHIAAIDSYSFYKRGYSMFRTRTSRCVLGVLLAALGLLCWAAPPVRAQVVKGTFTGTVMDQSGAVIPDATVTATNEGTNVSVSRKTGAEGFYTIPNLLPGFYDLK